jgi:transposase, IS30 family
MGSKKKVVYKRLRASERERISRWLAKKRSLRWIAEKLKRVPSTISREVRRGGCNRWLYRAVVSERRARRNARNRRKGKHRLVMNPILRRYVIKKLRLHWSPEQIVKSLMRDYPRSKKMRVSSDAVYAYLYVLPRGKLKEELLKCLRRKHKRRHRKSYKTPSSPRGIEGMLSIEERPKEVADRTIPGHWEGDLLIGRNRQSALGSLVERTTRTVLLIRIKKDHGAVSVRKAFARVAKKLPKEMRLSMTYDQGREMAEHKLFTKETEMQVYFAHPASPWERGTNENTNGLIRDFFPKGTDFRKVTSYQIKRVQHLLNGRPRKVLKWRTPYEAFKKLAGVALNN